MPDFRAAERTASLITQVAGRAGRFFPDGQVIVQTWKAGHSAIALPCQGDLAAFYASELAARQEQHWPPFARLTRLVFRSPTHAAAWDAATAARAALEPLPPGVAVLGPADCPLEKVAANYRVQLLLRGRSVAPLQSVAAGLLFGGKPHRGVHLEVDVDPVSML
jgi:primosomal protein N' (replication factor Y)